MRREKNEAAGGLSSQKKFLLLLVFALELISYLHDNNFPQATRGGAYSTNSLGDSKKARRKEAPRLKSGDSLFSLCHWELFHFEH